MLLGKETGLWRLKKLLLKIHVEKGRAMGYPGEFNILRNSLSMRSCLS